MFTRWTVYSTLPVRNSLYCSLHTSLQMGTTSTSHPPDIIHVIGVPRPSLFFRCSSASVYYTECNRRKNKVEEAWERGQIILVEELDKYPPDWRLFSIVTDFSVCCTKYGGIHILQSNYTQWKQISFPVQFNKASTIDFKIGFTVVVL